jgi:hypothetical protein
MPIERGSWGGIAGEACRRLRWAAAGIGMTVKPPAEGAAALER